MRRNRHPLAVLGPRLPVEAESVLGRGELPAVQQVAADHRPRPALARLAVHDGDVGVVEHQPLVDVLAERFYELDFGRVVVVEREYPHPAVELGDVVATFRTQVVYVVVVLVLRVEEFDDVVDMVAVDALYAGGGVTHRDDVGSYVWVG